MKTDQTNLPLDADGIPILTDLVSDDQPDAGRGANRDLLDFRTPEQIARGILASDNVKLLLNQMANDLARDVRLQLEQTLADAIDDAVNSSLEASTARTRDMVRQQLDAALPDLIARALHSSDLMP